MIRFSWILLVFTLLIAILIWCYLFPSLICSTPHSFYLFLIFLSRFPDILWFLRFSLHHPLPSDSSETITLQTDFSLNPWIWIFSLIFFFILRQKFISCAVDIEILWMLWMCTLMRWLYLARQGQCMSYNFILATLQATLPPFWCSVTSN